MNSIPRPGTLHLVATVSRHSTVIDRTGPGNSLAGRGAGYKTRLHQQYSGWTLLAMPGHLSPAPHYSLVTLQMVSALVALLQSPGLQARCLSLSSHSGSWRAFSRPPSLPAMAARCSTLHVVLIPCMATTRQPAADALPSRKSERGVLSEKLRVHV